MLVKAAIIFLSLQGNPLVVQNGWEVPQKLCGMSEYGAYNQPGGARIEGRLRVVCHK